MTNLIKRGTKGENVTELQTKMNQLGFKMVVDGVYGENTEAAVKELQTLFGYTVDGIVGEGTTSLINAQIGYGWNVTAPDAKQRAQGSQTKA